jgi:SAM-dependent methyltransferase
MLSPDAARLAHFIDANLPDMPTTFDEGLGIASERFAVNHMLLDFLATQANGQPLQRVLEAPVDGLMGVPGMNSVVFARELGAAVTVGSPSQPLLRRSREFWTRLGLHDQVHFDCTGDRFAYPDGSFDWVWNYCTFEHFNDARSLLLEMKRVSRRYVCVVTQNCYNWGYPIHRLYHKLRGQPWDHGSPRWMRMGSLRRLFRECDLRIVQAGCVDVPPWLDTFDMHIRGKIKGYMRKQAADAWSWSSLQEGDDERLAANGIIRWLERFQARLFFPLNFIFAHHFYVIAELEPAADHRPVELYDFAEGFGSVYGRYVRKRMAEDLTSRYGIRSVLEAPSNAESYFASPGTQSVPFARAGCEVTVLHPDREIVDRTRDFWSRLGIPATPVIHHADLYHLPFPDASFDLVWNFDSVPLVEHPADFIAEMARVSRDLVLVIVPNAANVGYPLHAAQMRLAGKRSPWGARAWMQREPVEKAMRSTGLEIVEAGLVDSPPWPGFDALHALGALVRRSTVESPRAEHRTEAQVERMLDRFTFIEYGRWPEPVKRLFTHQLYVIGRRPRVDGAARRR